MSATRLGWWCTELRRFAQHVGTGVLAVAAHYALMAVLIEAGTTPLLATTVGFAAGATIRFVCSYRYIFVPSKGVRTALTRFVVGLVLQAIANAALFATFTALSLGVWVAQVVTTVLLAFANYSLYRVWVFR